MALPRARFAATILLGALLCGGCDQQAAAPPGTTDPPAKPSEGIPTGKGFDFYVLSLSWSPSYCEAEGADANRQQCDAARPHGFVVHGLWPQFERGFPRDCPVDQSDVPRELMRSLYDIMPSAALIRHEWRTHGGCSGLGQEDYFAVLRAAAERVVLPPDMAPRVSPNSVEAAFVTANPGLAKNGIAVTCDSRYLREVRICLTKSLDFRSCPEVDRRGCRAASVNMPASE